MLTLLGVTLFVLGPREGSIDTNHDGLPDTPVVVAATVRDAGVSSALSGSRFRPETQMGRAITIAAAGEHSSTTRQSIWRLQPQRIALGFLSPLRC